LKLSQIDNSKNCQKFYFNKFWEAIEENRELKTFVRSKMLDSLFAEFGKERVNITN